MTDFNLSVQQRKELFQTVLERLENYYKNTKDYAVTPPLNVKEITDYVRSSDFDNPSSPTEAIKRTMEGLEKYTVHTPHPKYFGLYNPRANFAGILADLMTATYNPQLAAWSHAPFASEVENYLVQEIGQKFGYPASKIDGVFASGGAEANLTALLCALNHAYPNFAKNGLFGLAKRPIIYCSAEAHHSIDKAAKTVGLGYASVRSIPVDAQLKLDTQLLIAAMQEDLKDKNQPLMIVGTAGTTGTGVIDDLPALHRIAKDFKVWFHVDAAYGGGGLLNKKLRPLFKGVEHSDSITFDAHKWMSVPMAASLFLTSHPEILSKTFRITTEYMPKEAKDLAIVDPYTHSIQWSRRFIGLKVYLSLQIFGWKGFEAAIAWQTKMGNVLRQKLKESNWNIKNDTELPVVCFTDDRFEKDENFTRTILKNIIASGKSWLSIYPVCGISTFRVCMTNYSTTEKEVEELVAELNEERENYEKKFN